LSPGAAHFDGFPLERHAWCWAAVRLAVFLIFAAGLALAQPRLLITPGPAATGIIVSWLVWRVVRRYVRSRKQEPTAKPGSTPLSRVMKAV
jgi:hypothetical protein